MPPVGAWHTGKSKREVLRLAWPAVGSYILHNAYRINDQFWIQGLGGDAQAAIGTSFFVIILNFSVVFLAAGGTLALIARAVGARDPERVDSVTRHAILFGVAIAFVIGVTGSIFVEEITALLGLDAPASGFAEEYLGTLYALFLPIALVPVLDNVFIGRGRTKIPLCLDATAIAVNYFLNPVLIYGGGAVATLAVDGAAPLGSGVADSIAGALGIEPLGMRGAAIATCSSRALTTLLGIAILRFGFDMSLTGSLRPKLSRIADIARLSAPVSMSIAIFACVYLTIFALVMRELPTEVKGGLGIGFQVFEGVAFPCYLGIGIAGASLVGRKLGAKDHAGALDVVWSARFIGRSVGIAMTLLFLIPSRWIVPWFTQDPGVEIEAMRYVMVLACSQYWVSVETVNEKILLGSGHTRPILWIAGIGNVMRIPLAWILASALGLGALGVWWAINATTYFKAAMFYREVQGRGWLTRLEEELEEKRG